MRPCQGRDRRFKSGRDRRMINAKIPLLRKEGKKMLEDLKKKLNLPENLTSMGLGLLVVIVVGLIIFNSLTGKKEKQASVETKEESQASQEEEATESAQAELPAKYTVKKGEDLWAIAEKFYGSGYNWVDIVEKNKIANPDLVEAGTQLTIPAVTPRPTPKGGEKQVYTVKKGETLFDIAVRFYGDGFMWGKIAQANNLRNPNLIESGQKLVIPE